MRVRARASAATHVKKCQCNLALKIEIKGRMDADDSC